MRVLLAPDKFKGTARAAEVCEAMALGIRQLHPDFTIEQVPLADGGDGTLDVLMHHLNAHSRTVAVQDPLGRTIDARYALSADRSKAVIEMAAASGLVLLRESERNPMRTSTLGTGQLIADALEHGATDLVLGIGGSATNDGGTGMASALGFRFLDHHGGALQPIGSNLVRIAHIDRTHVHSRLSLARCTVLCDVQNPLYGPNGAAYVYAPQKGATAEEVRLLDQGLQHLAALAHHNSGIDLNFAGAGAAGGLGGGARFFLNARFESGIAFVSEVAQLAEKIAAADVVITGEGRVDASTFAGKVVSRVAEEARTQGKRLWLVCGQCDLPHEALHNLGIEQVVPLAPTAGQVADAMLHTRTLLEQAVRSFRW